ncbi:chitinase [Pinibacter soli]|uniref:Chitinase n=1 Tax=Pinibacter soli TaxID=3044211 RepID=A0ABT6RJJ8_9BACT|nr:chitinase [Pinibacter soli]MDI3322575.1 chitinase [Pinibacter soli]
MRKVIFAYCILLVYAFGTANSNSVPPLINKKQYEKMFAHHNAIFTYEAFSQACKAFPTFCSEGDDKTKKRELAAFFANASQETTGGWKDAPGGREVWGLVYTEEQSCKDGHCTQYNIAGTSAYKPVPGKSYHGRGPLQISYTYNYGLAGDELKLPLLEKPELASTDGIVSFKTAIWFWMRAQNAKPSCHDVMTGKWQPNDKDKELHREPGFGMTINIINGGVECSSGDPAIIDNKQNRIDCYKYYAKVLGTTVDEHCDCKGMGTY